jgi:hypothetical protein
LSNASRSPPTKIEMLPVSARWQPPDTGHSTAKAPSGLNLFGDALYLACIGGGHFHPHLAGRQALDDAVFAFQHVRTRLGRRQAGDHHITHFGHLLRAVRPGGAVVDELLRNLAAEVMNDRIKPVAHQAAGQLAAHIAQPDKPDLHGRPSKLEP